MSEKVRVELRLDEDVYTKLKLLADEGGVSLNALMNGITRWASTHGTSGKPYWLGRENRVATAAEPRKFWFGDEGDDGDEDTPATQAHIAFELDFTGESIVKPGGASREGKKRR